MKIPYNKPYYTGKEVDYVRDALNRSSISGDGYYTDLVTKFIKQSFDANHVFMTTSATHALELACMLIGLGPGDEVVMPSYTFPSTANAVMLRGAKVVFAEINEDNLNIDTSDLANKVTTCTKAIIPVHYGGVACEMDYIMEIAEKNNIFIIEDAAQSVNAKYKNKFLGTIGHFGCYSFHGTKNYTSGEGGALTLNTTDNDFLFKAEVLRQKGTNRNQFIRGEVDKYSWVDIGSSYVPSDILMAVLYAQLSEMERISIKRKIIHEYYFTSFTEYEHRGLIKMVSIPPECRPNYHLFYILLPDEKRRDKVLRILAERNISAATHFMPLHSSPMGLKLGYRKQDLPLTQSIAERLIRLPMYTGMTEMEMENVKDNLTDILRVI